MVVKVIKLLKKCKFAIAPKKNKPVLVFDARVSEPICAILNQNNFERLYFPHEKLVLEVAFLCLMKLRLSFKNYIFNYIKISNPKIVITLSDNNPFFYELKAHFPNIIFISIQSAWRCIKGDFFGLKLNKKKLSCDYLFCFNEKIGKMYQKKIKCKIYVLGSLLANLFLKPAIEKKTRTITFVSIWRKKTESFFSFEKFKREFQRKDNHAIYYSIEKKLLPYLAKFCEKNKISFEIFGAKPKEFEGEKCFYQSILKKCKYKFLKRKTWTDNYFKTKSDKLYIFCESTFGYELIGAGYKVFSFSKHKLFLQSPDRKFAWPLKMPSEGPFWTSSTDPKTIIKKIKNLCKISKIISKKKNNQINSTIMAHNLLNKPLARVLKNYNVQLLAKPETKLIYQGS